MWRWMASCTDLYCRDIVKEEGPLSRRPNGWREAVLLFYVISIIAQNKKKGVTSLQFLKRKFFHKIIVYKNRECSFSIVSIV